MRILKISGKNLASLAGLFSVDFEAEPLASSGLFAISGPTGAGKSTLLDALCLALYDDTPRLLKVGGRNLLPDVGGDTIAAQETRTLLRRGCADGYAEVDFVGNDGASYRARWSVRRSYNKAGGTLQAPTMTLHQLPGLQPLGGTKTEVKTEIVQRIGLTFEQFTRAVLLAQNEFSTFLKTEDNERGELLETLTGSTIYSEISMRAHARAKGEQEVLRRLGERLADQRPLAAEERSALDGDSAAADTALAALDLRQQLLEQQLRWFQEADKLRLNEAAAQQLLLASEQALEQAAPRHAALAELDAVQAARPLADDIGRIDAEIGRTETAAAASHASATQAQLQLEALAETAQRGAAALAAAEQAQGAAAPQLDQAKALDAAVAAQRPAHRQAALASQGADNANDVARAALRQHETRRSQLAQAQEHGAAWLAQHQPWQALAQEWPRWDVLFAQAEQAASASHGAAEALAALRQRARDSQAAQLDASARLAEALAAVQTLEAQRQASIAALAAFDPAALQRQRQQQDGRRALLTEAEKSAVALAGNLARRQQLHTQQAAAQAAGASATAAVEQEQARSAPLRAALAQAERSLKSAEAACAASVETLRANLRDEEPCPVCGAHEHPYRHDDGALRAMLAGLQREVTLCREQLDDNLAVLASQRAVAAAQATQLQALAHELATLDATHATLAPAWHEHAAALQLPADAPQAQRDWLAAQLKATQTALQSIEQQQSAMQRASSARDQAQHACDQAASAHARHAAAATAAASALAQASAEAVALQEKRAGLESRLATLLDELDGAFDSDYALHDGWKEHWHSAPARFHAQRQAESRQWLQQRSAHDERSVALAGIEIELRAAATQLARAEHDANTARGAYATLDTQMKAMQAERQALWHGQAVQEVEAQLRAAVDRARAELHTQQEARRGAEQARTRLDEALLQAQQRRLVLRADAQAAEARLESWLQQHADAAQPLRPRLAALLAVPAEAMRSERAALQALAAQAASAATVLAERRQQCALHQAHAPDRAELLAELSVDDGASAVTDNADSASAAAENDNGASAAAENDGGDMASAMAENDDADVASAVAAELAPAALAARLSAALATLGSQRKFAGDAAAALHVRIAQDQARRHQAQGMLAEIAAQEAIEDRWAKLSDLIGSSDGKKFRNYAQQFTLDVLLGYANAHLHQLARRYRLERISHSAHPSLGLMVRDLDMGGELRSVHSLSGGESFLLSLALALGLASLSSNRVRVESLFIDEGFGSLDSDTLRVAMDALDGLQAMGRKVGVISHVQEMTERIAVKILVRPAAGGRSTVSVQ